VSKLELLSRAHDREGFDCGSEQLNCFLGQTARQHSERGISRTFVLVEENAQEPKTVLGFFTLSICTVKCETLPPAEAKRLPRVVGGIKLGRLAVAKELQRKGVRKILVIAAMRKFADVFDQAGGIGLFVDAKDHAAKKYYEQFGFVPLPPDGRILTLPPDREPSSARSGPECNGARKQIQRYLRS